MKPLLLFLTSSIILLANLRVHAADPPAPAFITLRSTDGKSFEAAVLSLAGESVKVKRRDGKVFDVPLARLTPESAAEVRNAAAARDAPAAPPDKKAPVAKPTHPDQIETKFSVKFGEKVSASFEVKGDAVEKITILKTTDDKTPHFDVDFTGGKDGVVTAIVRHTFPKTIRYRCLGRNKDSKVWHEYNMIPAYSDFMNGEAWSGVEEIVLFGFKFTDEPRPR